MTTPRPLTPEAVRFYRRRASMPAHMTLLAMGGFGFIVEPLSVEPREHTRNRLAFSVAIEARDKRQREGHG